MKSFKTWAIIITNTALVLEDEPTTPLLIMDLQRLLQLLVTNKDIKLELKLFTALSTYLTCNKENYDIIVKCTAVYDKIHRILQKAVGSNVTIALNFLSALLYVDVVDDVTGYRKTLGVFARGRCRTSGCLALLTHMFTNSMMYYDTWKALCQCIAIACSECEMNQNYCTHLIPVCIRKCSETNIDVFLVLNSLLLNNKRNTQLFFEFKGASVFSRQLLRYIECLQLLTTVVQTTDGRTFLGETTVVEDLRQFIRLDGPCSPIGQKAMIILNYINYNRKGLDTSFSPDVNAKTLPLANDNSYLNDTMITNKAGMELDDTQTLMQNVMKEVYAYKQNERGYFNKSKFTTNSNIRGPSLAKNDASNHNVINRQHLTNVQNKTIKERRVFRKNKSPELSFSFLETMFNDAGRNTSIQSRNFIEIKPNKNLHSKVNTDRMKTFNNIQEDISNSLKNEASKNLTIDLQSFKPIFSSTPKHEDIEDKMDISRIPKNTSTKFVNMRHEKVKKENSKPKWQPKKNHNAIGKRSLSSRFFSAINESCTTLVKTVTNIFNKKESKNVSQDFSQSNSLDKKNQSCSFSFLEYMKKRDAFYSNISMRNRSKISAFSSGTQLCETCENTAVLKQKLTKDEHLKQTLTKLKLGINLYGCDFKKISRTMFPRESYMTPFVLYNLYRKLILK